MTKILFLCAIVVLAGCTVQPEAHERENAPNPALTEVAAFNACKLYKLKDGPNTIYVSVSGTSSTSSSFSCSIEVIPD